MLSSHYRIHYSSDFDRDRDLDLDALFSRDFDALTARSRDGLLVFEWVLDLFSGRGLSAGLLDRVADRLASRSRDNVLDLVRDLELLDRLLEVDPPRRLTGESRAPRSRDLERVLDRDLDLLPVSLGSILTRM